MTKKILITIIFSLVIFFSKTKTFATVIWTGTPNYEGDSITAGGGASSNENIYSSIVAATTFSNVNNTAVSGSSIRDVIYRRFVNSPTINDLQPLSLLIGTNDLLNSSSPYKFNKIAEGLRVVIANHFLNSFTSVADSSITKEGSWSSLQPYEFSFPSKSSLKGLGDSYYSSTAGDKLLFSINGDNLVVGCYGLDSVYNYGRFRVLVDGIDKGTYDPNGKSDDWYYSVLGGYTAAPLTPNVFIVYGLGSGNHDVEIDVLDDKETDFDYIGTMSSNNTKPVIVGHILKSTDAGYILGGGHSSDSDVDTANALIDSVVSSFSDNGYPVLVAHTENFFNKENTVDGLHPNDLGHNEVAQAWLSQITPIPSTPGNINFSVYPSSGVINNPSTVFVVSSDIPFDGTQTVTISDDTNDGVFTPSTGSSGIGSVTVTPANNSTSFTFTYTPRSSGSRTINLSNSLWYWPNPDPISYDVSDGHFIVFSKYSNAGVVNTESGNFTIYTPAYFDGTQTVTISDDTNDGVFTPSTGSSGIGSVTVTPANNSSYFTFTYKPKSGGLKTISVGNSYGWEVRQDQSINYYSIIVPSSVVAVAGDGKAQVNFSAVDPYNNTSVVGYTVSSIPAGGIDIDAGSTTLSHTITGLTNGIPYRFIVTTTDSNFNSAQSLPSNQITLGQSVVYNNSGGGGGGGGAIYSLIQSGISVPIITYMIGTSTASTTNLNGNSPLSQLFSFKRTLKLTMKGDDVKALQIYLNTHGYTIVPSGPGSKDHETNIFGYATKAAVIKFQKANKIVPASGIVGPLTIGKMK